ncbi:hypothetical protein EGW08_011010 [Elysia chlorotica]|uniref:Uridylate-specific endoribonuclease n=1 Tax=Elysia chlorotica TaxID=188477 RepID=A0A433TI84_ELYCH|nr:hypothetical protein EGW08_011010 [Elysia chlorotica]
MRLLLPVLLLGVAGISQVYSVSPASPATAGDGGGACKNFSQVTQELWTNDLDRLSADDVIVNYQAQLSDRGNIQDGSPQRFFSYVNESRLTSPVYASFLPLLDNYNPVKNVAEVVTAEKLAEEDHFLDVIFATPVWQSVYEYLVCEGKVQDQAGLRTLFKRLWFDLYPRSGKSTILDTSGFEHVMVGEFKSLGSVNGMHNWLAFYEKEKRPAEPNINYYGHTCDVHPDTMCAAFDWDGRKKRLSSFLLNVSPAYDLAVYSLCFVMHRGTCNVIVDGQQKIIRTYSKEGHIATAFIVA